MLKNQINTVAIIMLLSALTACGGSGGGNNGAAGSNTPNQPQNLLALAGDKRVKLSWDDVSTATAYDICRATETISQPVNCASHSGGVLMLDQINPVVIDSLNNSSNYYFVVIPKNTSGDGTASAVANASPFGGVATGKLNDTGHILCGDYADGGSGNHNNDLDCTLAADTDGDPIPPGQDATSGRDVNTATNDDNDGHKGFSFSKVDNNGYILSDQSGTTFSCVKDNVTGLIWEVKQTAVGLHNKDDAYTWFNTDAATNGGDNGTVNANASCEGNAANVCNTHAYVVRVNLASLCGANDWRLPTLKELHSLNNYNRTQPAIDTIYFPNTKSSLFWSSSPYALNSKNTTAWVGSFITSGNLRIDTFIPLSVRLVRSGQ